MIMYLDFESNLKKDTGHLIAYLLFIILQYKFQLHNLQFTVHCLSIYGIDFHKWYNTQ